MTIWLKDLADKPGPKYKAIAEAIAESIADGTLTDRAKLPTQRDLAYELGVSLNTVSRAYAEAIKRGYLFGEVGRGTYVRTAGPMPGEETADAQLSRPNDGPIDFTLNLPGVGESAACLAETLDSLKGSAALSSYLDYQAAGDLEPHAKAGAAWIGRLGQDVSADDVILTAGAQHGVLAAMLALMRPGDVLLSEQMTYAPIKTMAHHLGLKIFPVAMDGSGLLPDALDAACRTTAAKTLYCLPTLHTPTTVTMPEARRREIAAIARKHQLTVIEDDVFGFLPPDRPSPLACFAPERSVYVTSVSKSLAPGLRIGYVHAPSRLRRPIRAAVNMSCWMPPPLMAEIARRWIDGGTADRLNREQQSEAQARQQIAKAILGDHGLQSDGFGFHVWLPLPPQWRADAFRVEAEAQGVKVLTGETFTVRQASVPPGIRICLSYEPSRERVIRGLEIVARLFEETGEPGSLVV
jgi:DNA-binding transcriptional MocR family regulator